MASLVCSGLAVRHKRRLLLGCSGVVMAASPVVLRRHGVESPLLPYLPVAMMLHALLAYCLYYKRSKVGNY